MSLGIFVVPGKVVLFEHPGGSLKAPITSSDVVRYSNGWNASTAIIFGDDENGEILPAGFHESANTDCCTYHIDRKRYLSLKRKLGQARTLTTYNIHSDAALNPKPGEATGVAGTIHANATNWRQCASAWPWPATTVRGPHEILADE